jgi:hypothetical protein
MSYRLCRPLTGWGALLALLALLDGLLYLETQCRIKQMTKFCKFKFSPAPFLPFLAKIWQNSATKSSGQLYFSPAPFELFARSFGHLATLKPQKTGGGEVQEEGELQ